MDIQIEQSQQTNQEGLMTFTSTHIIIINKNNYKISKVKIDGF